MEGGNPMYLNMVQKRANDFFFQKLCTRAISGNFSSWYNQKMSRGEFLEMLRIQFGK